LWTLNTRYHTSDLSESETVLSQYLCFQRFTRGAHTNIPRYHCSEQQNGGQPGESGMPRTTQSHRHRRQVLHPTHSIGQLAIRGTWSEGQNLTDWYTVGIKNSRDIRLLSVGSTTAAHPLSLQQEVSQ
jgi:hypothetical protein